MKKITFLFLTLCCVLPLLAYDMQDEVTLHTACGQGITFTAQGLEGYHFVKWSDGSKQVTRTFVPTRDSVITAIFEIDTTVVVFYDWDGTVLKRETLEYGQAIVTPATDPHRDADEQNIYEFDGWSPAVLPTAPAATPVLEYTAVYRTQKQDYDVFFKNWNGVELAKVHLDYGAKLDTCTSVPGFGGQNIPQRPGNDTCEYVFRGWDKTLGLVRGEETYTAVYDTVYYLFDVTLTVDERFGSVVKTPGLYQGGKYHYGDVVQITVTNIDQCYKFVNWTITGTTAEFADQMTYQFEIHEDMNLTAILEQLVFSVTIRANNPTKGQVGGE
ncbi:MAG: hypothetical protein MJZ75_03200 [Paludibacteraceae bacterium]|nr:hypothetical protein [Paludibacteraceae bacterium]